MSMYNDIERRIARLPLIDPTNFSAKDVPKNGIAFFLEQSEGSRIVYVDTHKAESGLYTRLRKHVGTRNSSRAWRRTSDLRLALGGALLNHAQDPRIQEWADRQGERMPDVEALVTEQLLTTFTFHVLQVDALQERLSLGRELIGALSATPDITPDWLGRYANSSRSRESGLWNSEHVGSTEPIDLTRLAELACATRQ